jgi:tetratricopeptide (TPR) repeat protein
MTIALLTFALVAPALAFAAWPILRRDRRPGAAPALADDERAELENEKVIALRALRELELDRVAGHVSDEDYRNLYARYEADAIAVLRRLDALGPATRAAPTPAPVAGLATPWTRQPVTLGAMGAALLVFGVVLGLLVSRYSTPMPPEPGMTTARPEAPPAMPPGSSTSGTGGSGSGGAPRPLSKEMLEGMLRAAHASLDAGRYQEAIAAYTAILRRDPRNVDAITHFGVILAHAGHETEALEAFDRALAIDPNYPHALWDKAGVLEARQDHAGAVATLERFVRVAPAGPDRDRAQQRLRDARARLAAGPKAGAPVARP